MHEHRLGGLSYRLRSLGNRLEAFLGGEITEIPELDEELLPYWAPTRTVPYTPGEGIQPGIQGWRNMITVNRP